MWEKYWRLCRDFARRKDGAIIILIALALPIALGFAGLATDVGIWYNQKRQLQTAADAGALGGAFALSTTGVNTIVPYATADAKRNAYDPSLGSIVVNYPPASGPYAGNTGAVEVILEQLATLYFAKLFMTDPPIVHARAVALAQGVNVNLCILTLGGSGLWTQGTGDIVAPQCTLYSDTTLGTQGNSTMTALSVYAHTTVTSGGSSSITTTQGQHPNSPIVSDPLAGVPLPTYSGCNQTNFSSKITQTINPGVYCGGMQLNAKANVTMNPGIYIINGGSISINGQAALQGSGVTFVLTSSTGSNYPSVTINGGAAVTLSAPTSGTYANILFYSDRKAPAMTQKFNGGSTNIFDGILYFPTQSLNFSGNSGSANSGSNCMRTISLDLTVTGNSAFGSSCKSTLKATAPGGISLVE